MKAFPHLRNIIKLSDGRRIRNERQPRSALDHFVHGDSEFKGEVPENGEDGESGEEGSERVGHGDDECIPIRVVTEPVEGGVRDEGPEADGQREEGLGHRGVPNLGKIGLSNAQCITVLIP